jgi:hypothetical protein
MFSRRLHAAASLFLIVALGITAGALGGDDSTRGLRTPVISLGPTNPTASTSATFWWDPGRGRKGDYECRLDGALEWLPCESPLTYPALKVGVHVFDVLAVDGDIRTEPARYLWSIEPPPPSAPATPTITSGPASATTSTGATFAFSSTTASVTYLCRLDAASFAACASPKSYSGLAVGQHTFEVKAQNATGLQSGVASRSWTIQTAALPPPPPSPTPPATPTITSGPASATTSTGATFAFSSTTASVSYLCRLDAASWAACSSPKSYSGLAVGQHTFDVKAQGSTGLQSGVASRSWMIQTAAPPPPPPPPSPTPPATPTITSGPASATTSTGATFAFSSTTAGVSYLCRLDAASFAACSSPKSYSGLAVGQHTFEVKARDSVGLESGTASRAWEVQASPPTATPPATPTIDTAPQSTTTSTSASFTFSDKTSGVAFLCRLDAASFATCTSPKSYSGLAVGQHTFEVKARDGAGLESGVASVSWRVDALASPPPPPPSPTPPATPTITSAPPSTTTATIASFAFSSTTSGVSYLCRLDAAAFAACTSPKSYSGLAVGQHSFDVKARSDAGLDSGVASVSWQVQAPLPPPPSPPTPPATPTITSSPTSVTNATSASFAFSSTTSGVTYLCRVDAAAFAACTSPKSYSSLVQGAHDFAVKARDASGLDSGVASTSWTIDLTPPVAAITAPAPGTTLSRIVTVTATASDDIRVERVEFRVDTKLKGTSTVAPHTFSWDTATETNGSHLVEVRSYDVAGNQSAPATQSYTVSNTSSTSSCAGVPVDPGTDVLQSLVSSRPEGTTFCLRAGVHRLSSPFAPKSNDSFVGDPGAVLNGSRLLTGFVQSGAAWYVGGQTMESYSDPGYGDNCGPPFGPAGNKLCLYNNDVYYDDTLLKRVGSVGEVGPGKFFFDYGADRIYVGNNPAGHKVEVGLASQADHAFGTGTSNVHFTGLIVEKFASPAGDGALQGRDGYTFDKVEVRLNHAGGIQVFASVKNSYVHDNGQYGVSGDNTSGMVVEGNEFRDNHRIKLACWHSSDVRIFGHSLNTVIRSNYVHDNPDCGGLWEDWDIKGAVFEGNRIENVGGPAIMLEASCNTTVRNNTIRNAGRSATGGGTPSQDVGDGSAIIVSTAANVEIYGNSVSGSRHGINALSVPRNDSAPEPNCGVFRTTGLKVHDNQIDQRSTGTPSGYGIAGGVTNVIYQPFTTQAFFDRNTYTICSGTLFGGPDSSTATSWAELSWSAWRARGEDPSSTVSFVC